jgi:hypothetical protein
MMMAAFEFTSKRAQSTHTKNNPSSRKGREHESNNLYSSQKRQTESVYLYSPKLFRIFDLIRDQPTLQPYFRPSTTARNQHFPHFDHATVCRWQIGERAFALSLFDTSAPFSGVVSAS